MIDKGDLAEKAINASGFRVCAFTPDKEPCDSCDLMHKQLFFRNTDYFSNEGEYFCVDCIVKEYHCNEIDWRDHEIKQREEEIQRLEKKLSECYEVPWTRIKPDGLDGIDFFFENHEPEKGSVTIRCLGEAWTAYWPSIGERSIEEFFAGADIYYLAGSLEHPETQGKDGNWVCPNCGSNYGDPQE